MANSTSQWFVLVDKVFTVNCNPEYLIIFGRNWKFVSQRKSSKLAYPVTIQWKDSICFTGGHVLAGGLRM
jgi:hypothetical protein